SSDLRPHRPRQPRPRLDAVTSKNGDSPLLFCCKSLKTQGKKWGLSPFFRQPVCTAALCRLHNGVAAMSTFAKRLALISMAAFALTASTACAVYAQGHGYPRGPVASGAAQAHYDRGYRDGLRA